jgi:hypothetical protein
MRLTSCIRFALALLGASAALGCATSDRPDGPTAENEAHLVAPPVQQYAILARHGAQFADRAFVIGGALGVAPSANGTPNVLSAGRDARIGIGQISLAQRVVLGDFAGIGDVGFTTITVGPNATTGVRAAYVAPPPAPQPGTFTAGTTTVNVAQGQTTSMSHGKFVAVVVNGGTHNLSGGLY